MNTPKGGLELLSLPQWGDSASSKKRLPPRQPPNSLASNNALAAFVVHPYLHLFHLLLITGDLGRLVDVEQAADDTDDDARLPEGNVEGVEEGY